MFRDEDRAGNPPRGLLLWRECKKTGLLWPVGTRCSFQTSYPQLAALPHGRALTDKRARRPLGGTSRLVALGKLGEAQSFPSCCPRLTPSLLGVNAGEGQVLPKHFQKVVQVQLHAAAAGKVVSGRRGPEAQRPQSTAGEYYQGQCGPAVTAGNKQVIMMAAVPLVTRHHD